MIARRSAVLVLAAGLVLGAPTAIADPPVTRPVSSCPSPGDAWNTMRGDLAPGVACGSLVLSTDASSSRVYIAGLFRRMSLARIARREPVTVPYELTMDWQWLTPGRWTLEIHGLEIIVLLGLDTIGFYVDDAQLMGDTFEPISTALTSSRHRITVRQTAREIEVSIDGKPVGRRTLPITRTSGSVTIGIRGIAGERTRGAFRWLRVRALTSP